MRLMTSLTMFGLVGVLGACASTPVTGTKPLNMATPPIQKSTPIALKTVTQPDPATRVPRPDPILASEIQNALRHTNALRAEKGLKPLQLDDKLTAYAQLRASELATHFSHTRPNGKIYHHALSRGHSGENIAAGHSSAQKTVLSQWRTSKGHYGNMIKPSYSKIGIGLYHAPNSRFGYYWVQVFGDDGTTAPFVFE